MKAVKPMSEKQAAYDAWYLAEVQKGLDDLAAGRAVSDEEAQSYMDRVFADLETENRKAA